MPADIIIYAAVAAGLVFWLKSILGTRHGDEHERQNPYSVDAVQDVKSKSLSVAVEKEDVSDLRNGLDRNMNIENKSAEEGLLEIQKVSKDFNLSQFMSGAQEAFIMIVEAFARGDRDTLKSLLSEPVYNAFESVITEREKNEEVSEVEIQAVRRADVIDAKLKDKVAYITVRFVADEINLLRDKDGQLIAGNEDQVTDTIDLWTFGRSVKSRDPAWLVYETRDEDAADSDHKTVPDA